jgi:tetratricopeptide (TPR) repeat protein
MKPLLLLVLFSWLGGQLDEIEVGASLNRRTVRVGETVVLTVTLRAPGLRSPEIEDPRLDGFEVLSKSDRTTVRYSASLGWVREFSREYILRALQAGELTIPPIRALVNATLYETEALGITVEQQGAATRIPGGLSPRPEEEVAVRLWVEPETAYVGQQVTMTVGAFFDPAVRGRLQRQPEYRPPDVQGFWTADLPGSGRPERRVVGRREYFVQIYRRALFPLSAGTLRIPPAAVIYEVRRGLIYAPETFEVESAPTEVVVLPLPQEGMPVDFTGAVGRYDTEILFDRSDVRAGEAVRLILDVTGSGNISSLTRPALPEMAGVRVYEGGEEGEVQLRGVEFAGHKRFSWVLVPERAGQYVVPQLRLPYFDPLRGSYVVELTEPLALDVGPATDAAAAAGGASGTAIRFVKARPSRQPLDLKRSRAYWAVQALPLLILLAALAFGRYQRRAPAAARPRPRRRRQLLRDLRPVAESGDPAFFGQLRLTLLSWLETRLHRPRLSARGLVQIQNVLEDTGVPPPVALQMVDLLERCGRLRYTADPPDADTALQMLAEASRLLALVDAEAVSEKGLRSPVGERGPLGPLVLLLVALVPARAVSQPDTPAAARLFQEGVSAYGRGDYAGAAQLFRAALAERPRDPSLLYNLGNAYYELDDRGRAVAYWVRSLRLRPRDGDARFNLRLVVGDDPVLGSALPPLPLSSEEMALLFSVLWFGGCAALIARQRWRRGSLTFAGGALLSLAVLGAAELLYPRAEYAVIAHAEAVLRKGPVRQSEILTTAAPGTGYRVQERRGEWLRVSRGSENEGWVERAQLELIE